jgi:hypothetical protein
MNKLELCQKLIEEAMKCLENNDRECVMRLIEELVRNQCHDGRLIGKEIADGVRGVIHELWSRDSGNDGLRCELLMMLKNLGISKRWVRSALDMNTKTLNKWLIKCGIELGSKARRVNIVKIIEGLLREKFGWSETKMCEELWRFIGVDVNEFRRHGIEPCSWLIGLEGLGDLKRPYWFGLRVSDLVVIEYDEEIELELGTTNTVGAIFFATLSDIPSLRIEREREVPGMKYVHEPIRLVYYIDLGVDEWPWPIKLSADEFERILNGFSDEELAEFVGGLLDGDGAVLYNKGHVVVWITVCKTCPKRANLDALKNIITERFNVFSSVYQFDGADALVFRGKDAVKLLRLIRPFVHHPLRRLRIELILALYDGRISREVFEKLYEMTEYERGKDDIKRNRGLDALTRAAPQTHTHGKLKTTEYKITFCCLGYGLFCGC